MSAPIHSIAIATIAILFSSGLASTSACDAARSLQNTSNSTTLAQANTNTQIIPGVRVGPMTAQTTRQYLVTLFGQARLVDRTIPGPEGIGTFAATHVNWAGGRSFTVVWTDAKRTKPLHIRDFGSAWSTPEGIRVGMSMSDLRQQLGEFRLTGLGWDYGGGVLLENTKLARYSGKLILRVDAAANAAQKYPGDYRSVSGDRVLWSSNSHWKPLGIRVTQITVPLNRLADESP